jgi:hypothetical protein
METLKDILWPVVIIGGLGAFIDFLIGKTGQAKAKDFLITWWVRFDDVRWKNFGREEGLFAGRFIEKWFGRRIWSVRRIVATLGLFVLFLLIGWLREIISKTPDIEFLWWGSGRYLLGAELVSALFIGFCVAMSFTKLLTFGAAYLCGVGKVRNLIIFLVMLFVNYLMMVLWSPITATVRVTFVKILVVAHDIFNSPNSTLTFDGFISRSLEILTNDIPKVFAKTTLNTFYPKNLCEVITNHSEIDLFAFYSLESFPTLLRFCLVIIFIGSFLVRPLVMRPVNLVWRRIVESERPVFTVIFGGAAAFATAVSEAAKHL